MTTSKIALLGFSVAAMEGLSARGRPFVSVVPPGFEAYMEEHSIPFLTWDFSRLNERSGELAQQLIALDAKVAVPLFEETVEWAGALNAHFRDDPRLFTRYLLFRDKAMMKRRAQMGGLRIGLFEEAESKDDATRFVKRVTTALAKLDRDEPPRIHLKPLDAAGAFGHRMLRRLDDVETLTDANFPCILETHLEGQEFSCEVFVHRGQVKFLNITEYLRLGHTNFVPAGPRLESRRPVIQKAVEALIKAFDIEYGMIHPEFFITEDDEVSFGEVAARVPGGHIFELIHKAWGFDPFVGFALCCDPATSDAELAELFPAVGDHKTYAGCVMVYPQKKIVSKVEVPDELVADPYYDKHNLFVPITSKVAERVAFGNHYGTVYFAGPDPARMHELLRHYDEVDFYVEATAAEPLASPA
ncbi:MAG: ATP-grasp domain-containing protein [Myxococcales bacterium]|nr:ATP-grasp domain-containing protein [Myxococcales bacterium]